MVTADMGIDATLSIRIFKLMGWKNATNSILKLWHMLLLGYFLALFLFLLTYELFWFLFFLLVKLSFSNGHKNLVIYFILDWEIFENKYLKNNLSFIGDWNKIVVSFRVLAKKTSRFFQKNIFSCLKVLKSIGSHNMESTLLWNRL